MAKDAAVEIEAPAGLVEIDANDVDAGWKFVEINSAEHKAFLAAQAPVVGAPASTDDDKGKK